MENLSTGQRELLGKLEAIDASAVVRWDDDRGVATSVRGTLARRTSAKDKPAAIVKRFLAQFGGLFGPPDLARTVRVLRSRTDDLGWTHLEYRQMVRPRRGEPLEIYGARVLAHVTGEGVLREVQSSAWRDVVVEGVARITAAALRRRFADAAAQAPGYAALARRQRGRAKTFPLVQPPRLVVYWWQGRFRLTWAAYTYAIAPGGVERSGGARGGELALGQAFVDATTGELFLFSPTRMHAELPVAGTGLGVTKDAFGGFVVRPLNVVQVDATATHRLRDTTHARDIITYDLAVNPQWATIDDMVLAVAGGSLPVSQSNGNAWNAVANPPLVSRAGSQQPEVDAHFLVREAYEWHAALSSRKGWDDDRYPVTAPQVAVRVATHVYPFWRVNAGFDMRTDAGGRWIPLLMFWDCDPGQQCTAAGDRGIDYMAGSRNIVGHEYQHGVTAFSFDDGAGNPGLGYASWTAAVHEGLADVFGGLFSDVWTWAPEIAPTGLMLRNAAFPRDPATWENRPGPFPCGWGHANKDHFADRLATPDAELGEQYDHGTILAHAAFLMAAGGVHQRAGRAPVLIPVRPLPGEVLNGRRFSAAARLWYRALDVHLSAHVTLTGRANLDERMFRALRDGCRTAAEDIHGAGTVHERTARLAFYAVGLQPPGEPYGADVTCMSWGVEWARSRPYLGGIYAGAPDWGSVDLFVNNDGVTSEWNALVNMIGGNGVATHFENSVFCRVRNVGDLNAANVVVSFFYAKLGTVPTGWLPVTDQNGVAQTLTIPVLAAGQATFPEASQSTPPAAAGVKWDLPPLAAGELVDHYCLKAHLTCAGNANRAADDVNPWNDDVQSNVAYVAYAPLQPLSLKFVVGNPEEREMRARLVVTTELPHGFSVSLPDSPAEIMLAAGEERMAELRVAMPAGAETRLAPPLDGLVDAEVQGPRRRVHGALTATQLNGDHLTGRLAVDAEDGEALLGAFEGRLDGRSGALTGQVAVADAQGQSMRRSIALAGRLRPWRRIHVAQTDATGRVVGGFTVQIQGATPADLDAPALPGARTCVSP